MLASTAGEHRGLGIFYGLAAGFCLSLGGPIVRLMEAETSGWQMLFWRSLAFAALMGVIAFWRAGSARQLAANLAGIGKFMAPIALCVGLGQIGYMLGMVHTTVANVAFLLGTAPLITAFAGWALFAERLSRLGVAALLVAMAGIAIMFGGGLEADHLFGVLCAVGAVAAYVSYILLLRHARSIDTFLASALGGLLGAAIAFGSIDGATLPALKDVGLSFLSGTIQVGAGFAFATLAAMHLKAAEVTLLVLLESILGPLFTWMLVGEVPAPDALTGGGIVLAAVIAYLLVSLAEERRRARAT